MCASVAELPKLPDHIGKGIIAIEHDLEGYWHACNLHKGFEPWSDGWKLVRYFSSDDKRPFFVSRGGIVHLGDDGHEVRVKPRENTFQVPDALFHRLYKHYGRFCYWWNYEEDRWYLNGAPLEEYDCVKRMLGNLPQPKVLTKADQHGLFMGENSD